jgi:predicted nucleic acid-binding protein
VRTAIDTNILSALWSDEPAAVNIVQQLGNARSHGALLISPVVYAELLAHPKLTESSVNGFLSETGITVDFAIEELAWVEAGGRFAHYAGRRRKERHGHPKRLLADFLIGSHALLQADRLMSLDATRYKQYFPELKLV